MIITFCGHADFLATEEYERRLLALLEKKVGDSTAIFYLGGYGAFDSFAYKCCRKYKTEHSSVTIALISPYIDGNHKKGFFYSGEYDEIIYPSLENVPPRFAISHRNRRMAEKADTVIAYVDRSFGGAWRMLKYAQKMKKEIINLADKK